MQSTRWRGRRAALVLAAAIAVGTTQAHETLYLDDGRVYLGEVRDGRPHGEGRMRTCLVSVFSATHNQRLDGGFPTDPP